MLRWDHPEPRLASFHLVFDTGDASSDRLIWRVTRKIIQILEISPTTEIARQAYFNSDSGNHLDSSLSPLHDRSSPLRLPQLHRQRRQDLEGEFRQRLQGIASVRDLALAVNQRLTQEDLNGPATAGRLDALDARWQMLSEGSQAVAAGI